MQCMLLI